jgi:hypothetical protein
MFAVVYTCDRCNGTVELANLKNKRPLNWSTLRLNVGVGPLDTLTWHLCHRCTDEIKSSLGAPQPIARKTPHT